MPKLYSSKYIIKVLEKHKFIYVSQKGSHIKYRKHGRPTLTHSGILSVNTVYPEDIEGSRVEYIDKYFTKNIMKLKFRSSRIRGKGGDCWKNKSSL